MSMSDFPVSALTGAVLRAARALTGVSAAQLAEDSGVGERTILRAESEDGRLRMREGNARALVESLQRRGVKFLAAGMEGGSGLRWEHINDQPARESKGQA